MPKRIAPPSRRPGIPSVARLLTQQQAQRLEAFGRDCDAAFAAGLRVGYIKAGIIKPAKEMTTA